MSDQLPLDDSPSFAPPPPLPIRGHAAQPGTGPQGETCQTCQHYCSVWQHTRRYRRCYLRQDWTMGAATDIRAKDPACSKWEANTP